MTSRLSPYPARILIGDNSPGDTTMALTYRGTATLLLAVLTTATLGACAAAAQQPDTVDDPVRVRITLHDGSRLEGHIVNVRADSLILLSGNATAAGFARADITSAEQRMGAKNHTGEGLAIGLMVGAVVGALNYKTSEPCRSNEMFGCMDIVPVSEGSVSFVSALVTGGVLGAFVGSRIKVARWEQMHLQASAAPPSMEGYPTLRLQGRF
jgi:hypothetical protein